MFDKSEYPRPDFIRERWRSLDGEWDFAFDHDNIYENNGRIPEPIFDRKINVPFSYESKLSGIGTDEYCGNLWYGKSFHITESDMEGSILLKFGAVDYKARVWVNGHYIGDHIGGYTPFEFEISKYVSVGENRLLVKAEDSYSKEQTRGKQMWGQEPKYCWYTNTSGIWQSVWLEFTGPKYIESVFITPDIDNNECKISISVSCTDNCEIMAELSMNGNLIGKCATSVADGRATTSYQFGEYGIESEARLYWSPEFPNLIDVRLFLIDGGKIVDEAETYFGMRKISCIGDKIYLNNRQLYQRLVLDQGYWPDSLLTPPSGDALKLDVELTRKMGFNGARKHQKIEDPRYYYWADKLGLLVWGELPSAYIFTENSVNALIRDMGEFIRRDYNHPCIITWVPLNESWGVFRILSNEKEKNLAKMMYHYIKSLDDTRLVSTNDGWEQVNPTDIVGIHDYTMDPESASEKYGGDNVYKILETTAQSRIMYSEGERYSGQPILVSEYGGIKLKGSNGWGYNDSAQNEDELVSKIRDLTKAITRNDRIAGFCYTQLSDVMQETNGLTDMQRKPKAAVEKIRDAIMS
ncbi:MAG TPA: glycoside hydrolase family 2 [Clostridiaceae bacterium]|nr:glycoside hydrolase family 2 [Clostridiaceae bacterium]